MTLASQFFSSTWDIPFSESESWARAHFFSLTTISAVDTAVSEAGQSYYSKNDKTIFKSKISEL